MAAVLSGCAGMELQKAEMQDPTGSAFQKNLYTGYIEQSSSEYGEGDYGESDYFARKAMSAGEGNAVEPTMIGDRTLPSDKVDNITSARGRLMTALAAGAGEKAPADAARAQVMFDCWMEEQEENIQPEDIEGCKSEFFAALQMAEKAVEPKPMAKAEPAPAPAPLPPVPGPYVVYFAHDSFDLDNKAMAIIKEAAAMSTAAKVTKAVLSGFADRSGSDGYNKGLSRARVAAAGNALMEAGVSRKIVVKNYYGEDNPKVATPDGVRNDNNRRVEIVFER